LERQRGGGGFLGGPGETQIELDRRHIDNRILKIKKELEKVKKTRGIQRSARVKVPYPTVALVGYTNAGKSTLFNYVTKAEVFAKDMLFATLDPTMRKIVLSDDNEVILSDTVGFISNLPHELVMAFRATLEEVLQADIIVHVIDVSNVQYKEQKEDVLKVLHELGLTKIEFEDKYVEVYNKVDVLGEVERAHWLERKGKNAVALSALTGDGVENFLELVKDKLAVDREILDIVVDLSDGKKIADIYEKYKVIGREDRNEDILFKVM
jgi:GTP-binding protein HflX